MRINPERDYIRVSFCSKCKRRDMSVVVHHPRNHRSYTICNFCSKDTWLAVGMSNKENYLKYGEVTKPSERRSAERRNGRGFERKPHERHKKNYR
jgi:hypothetical protein